MISGLLRLLKLPQQLLHLLLLKDRWIAKGCVFLPEEVLNEQHSIVVGLLVCVILKKDLVIFDADVTQQCRHAIVGIELLLLQGILVYIELLLLLCETIGAISELFLLLDVMNELEKVSV